MVHCTRSEGCKSWILTLKCEGTLLGNAQYPAHEYVVYFSTTSSNLDFINVLITCLKVATLLWPQYWQWFWLLLLLTLLLHVAQESEWFRILDPVRHREHHQRLAQGHPRHHPSTGKCLEVDNTSRIYWYKSLAVDDTNRIY